MTDSIKVQIGCKIPYEYNQELSWVVKSCWPDGVLPRKGPRRKCNDSKIKHPCK